MALTATPKQLSILTDNLQTVINEPNTDIADEDSYLTMRNKATDFYLSLAIGDLEQNYLKDEE